MKNKGRQILAFFLLAVLLIKVCLIPVMYVDFELRREYIISKLCENRNRPAMNCKGKCYLAKRLAALNQQEKRQAARQILPAKLLSYVVTTRMVYDFDGSVNPFKTIPKPGFIYSSCFLSTIVVDEIFHPPLV